MYTEGPSLYLYRHIYTIQYTTECLYAYSVMPTSFSTASFVKHPSLSKFIKWIIFLTGNAQFTEKSTLLVEDYSVLWRKKGNFSFSSYVHCPWREGGESSLLLLNKLQNCVQGGVFMFIVVLVHEISLCYVILSVSMSAL